MKNFLKSDKHTHKDPQIRIASLDSMDSASPENQLLIEQMATTDDDENVRLAAINNLSTVSVLRRVHDANRIQNSTTTEAAVTRAIEHRIGDLLSENSISEAEADDLLETGSALYAPLLAINSTNESIRNRSIARIDDQAALLSVLEQTRFHDVRMACAKKLVDEDKIKTALIACRSRDKAVAKMLQSQIDEKTAAIAEQKASTEAVSATLSSMRSLASSVWSPQHAGRHYALVAKWESLDSSHRSAYEGEFGTAGKRVQTLIDEHKKLADAENTGATKTPGSEGQSSQEAAHKSASDAKTKDERESTSVDAAQTVAAASDPNTDALLEKLKLLQLTELDSFITEDTPAAGSTSEQLLAHAKSVGVLFNPPYELAKGRPGAITARIKRVRALLKTDSILPGVDMDACLYIVELKAHADALENRLEKAKQESVDRAKATSRQFSALDATVADGKWGPASSMFRRLQKKVDSMETAERAQFNDKLARAEKQLAEMADWQDFAARPKLEALCDSMEALPAQELKPETLAKEIKSIQSQWKSLGASRASNELWTRFKTAGDTAYEPCKVFFEEKQHARQAKQDAKTALCEQLESDYKTLDWETPDWKSIQRTVNNAKRDWSRNRIPDRKPDRALEQRFSDVLKPYEEKLGEQYDANVVEKQELIEKIRKLAEADINQHSANQAKRLQSAWKQVGPVRRKDDQALWEEFNGHCKVIYKHQHDAKREQYQASMSHVFRAREIIKTLRKISKGQDVAISAKPVKDNQDSPAQDSQVQESQVQEQKSADKSTDAENVQSAENATGSKKGKSADNREQQIQALQAEFQGLADFPDKDKKFLLRDFRGALDACSKLQENASRKRAKDESAEIDRLVELCEQLEAAVESRDMLTDTLTDDVAHAWENSQASIARETSNKLVARRDTALNHLDANTSYDYDANETHRRQLLIQMEILSDKETPAEDKALRMQYQLEHLREGMTSSAVVDKRNELAKLQAAWQAAAPVKRSVKDSLHSRYLIATNR